MRIVHGIPVGGALLMVDLKKLSTDENDMCRLSSKLTKMQRYARGKKTEVVIDALLEENLMS